MTHEKRRDRLELKQKYRELTELTTCLLAKKFPGLPPHVWEEIAVDAFVTELQRSEQLGLGPLPRPGRVVQLAVWRATDEARHRKVQRDKEISIAELLYGEPPSTSSELDTRSYLKTLIEHLRRVLPPRPREVLDYLVEEAGDVTRDEIADQLGVSSRVIKRALENIRHEARAFRTPSLNDALQVEKGDNP